MFALIDQSWYEASPLEEGRENLFGRYPAIYKRKRSRPHNAQYHRSDVQKQRSKIRHLHLVSDLSLDVDLSNRMNQKGRVGRIKTAGVKNSIKQVQLSRISTISHTFTAFSDRFPEIIVCNSEFADLVISHANKKITPDTSSFYPVSRGQSVPRGIKLRRINGQEIQSGQSHMHRKSKDMKKRSLWLCYLAMFALAILVLCSMYPKHRNIAVNSVIGRSLVISHNETLAHIAHTFAPDLPQSEVIDEIMRLNNLQSNYVSPGEVIVMPNI